MKTVLRVLLSAVLVGTQSVSALEIGDSADSVIRELGPPTGHIRTSQRELLSYPRGEVELISNRVSRFEIVSAEEAVTRIRAREEALENNRRWAATQQAVLHEQGTLELARVRDDTAFAFRSAEDQVAYWKDFRRRFPTVDVRDDYAASLRLLELDLREQRLAEERRIQIQDLERRVAAAEARARDAEREAQRPRIVYNGWNTAYPVVYPYPVTIIRRTDCRPVHRPVACKRTSGGISISVGSNSGLVRGDFGLVRN